MIDLPDINVWLSLIDENHSHHDEARSYWDHNRLPRVAFCRITMLGLFRIGTNPKAMVGEAFSFAELWNVYDTFLQLPDITFLEEPELEAELRQITESPEFRQHHWTDAYLAAFAKCADCRLVTFDKNLQVRAGSDSLLL